MAVRIRPFGLAFVGCVLASPLSAQLPFGPEQQVNSYTSSLQEQPDVAVAPDGSFLVVWTSWGSNGPDPGIGIQARRFGNGGGPLGGQFVVNQQTEYNQTAPEVASGPGGTFLVTWTTYLGGGPHSSSFETRARRLAANGSPMGAEFVVAEGGNYTGSPRMATGADGSFVVVWQTGDDLVGRRFSVDDELLGTFTISRPGPGAPSPSIGENGAFVVAWSEFVDWKAEIRAQRFDADGEPQGAPIEVTGPSSAGEASEVFVVHNAQNRFLVAWTATESSGTDHWDQSIQSKTFDEMGTPLGPQLQVNVVTAGAQYSPRAATAPDGSFVVAWTDYSSIDNPGPGDEARSDLRARHLASDGSALGTDFAVNSFTTQTQFEPAVAVLPGGNFLFTWTSLGSYGDDTSEFSVQARRFRRALFADGFESGDLARWVVGGD